MIYLADYQGSPRAVGRLAALRHGRSPARASTSTSDVGEPHGPWWIPLGTRTIAGPGPRAVVPRRRRAVGELRRRAVPVHAAVAVPRRRPALPVADDLRPRRPRPAHVSPALAVRLRSRRRARRRVRALRRGPLAARRAARAGSRTPARPTRAATCGARSTSARARRSTSARTAGTTPRCSRSATTTASGRRSRRAAAAGSQPFPAAYVGDEALDGDDVIAVVRRARPLRSIVPVHRRAVDPRRRASAY